MRKLFGCALAVSLSLLPTIVSAPAAIASTSAVQAVIKQECDTALGEVGRLLLPGRQLDVTDVYYSFINDGYRVFPAERPGAMNIVIDGEDANAVMRSPQLLTTVARAFIEGCRPVGLVTFGVPASDWTNSFGLINGRVQPFQCVEPGEAAPTWGFEYCF